MSEFIAYACKVCGNPGMVEYEPVKGRDFSSWASILCHSRCADFMAAKDLEERAINSILAWYQRKLKEEEEDQNSEAREKARVALVKHTKIFCRRVCTYYRKPFAWEPSMVDDMLGDQSRMRWILYDFERRQKTAIYALTLSQPQQQS